MASVTPPTQLHFPPIPHLQDEPGNRHASLTTVDPVSSTRPDRRAPAGSRCGLDSAERGLPLRDLFRGRLRRRQVARRAADVLFMCERKEFLPLRDFVLV